MNYEIVIPARNEEKYLEKTLQSVKEQTIPPNRLIVVDDGSTDRTYEIACLYADLVIKRIDRGFSALGTTEITEVFNAGLREVSEDADFVLINGADDILPPNYVEVLYNTMVSDPLFAMISGRTHDEAQKYTGLPPHGGGRLVNADLWRQTNGLQYPKTLGWETWLIYKFRMMGYRAEKINNISYRPQRPPIKGAMKRAYEKGKEMKALGYTGRYTLLRAIQFSMKSPIAGFRLLLGYFSQKEQLDCAEWVANEQRRIFWKRLGFHLKRILRLKK